MEDKPQVCEYTMREGTTGYRQYGQLRCASLAAEGSRYCPVHTGGWKRHDAAPAPRVKRDLDLDVLPWGGQQQDGFANATEKKRRSR